MMAPTLSYWGIKCRTCGVNVAFGTFETTRPILLHASLATGVYRCRVGHRHVYYFEDESHFTSAESISEDTMEGNRCLYQSLASALIADSVPRKSVWTSGAGTLRHYFVE